MADKESKTSKRFPRRLLSSFRRTKKIHLQPDRNGLYKDLHGRVGLTAYDIENAENENAIIDLEATIILDSPSKNSNAQCPLDGLDDSVTSKRYVRSGIEGELQDVPSNLSSPRVPRLKLGRMSASADSGIDCSILLSERNSPEQFVAFTRREAERLRQEQLHNGSVLETLDEVEKSSSDSEVEIERGTDIEQANIESVGQVEGAECAGNEYHGHVEGGCSEAGAREQYQLDTVSGIITPSDAHDCGVQSVATENEVSFTENSLSYPAPSACKSDTVCGDYVFLKQSTDLLSSPQILPPQPDITVSTQQDLNSSPMVDVTQFISNNRVNRLNNEQLTSSNFNENQSINIASLALENGTLQSSRTTSSQNTVGINDYMDYYTNRTDETKSAEAQIMHENVTHAIVNPIPVTSSSIATHRVLESTQSPARLYVNENSAFAKCKSLKRSVSDVGKGILGRFRHRSKESTMRKEVGRDSKARETNKMGVTKPKTYHDKKEKGRYRSRHSSEQLTSSNTDIPLLQMETGKFNQSKIDVKQIRNPRDKEKVISTGVALGKKLTSNASITAKSPVYKEILDEKVKQQLESNLLQRLSPNVVESIQDLTSSISEMTTALCASSAESIACICDCKNRYSNPDCCEKRNTPPLIASACPALSASPRHETGTEPIGEECVESLQCQAYIVETNENEITECSPLLSSENNVLSRQKSSFSRPICLFVDKDDEESSDESSDETSQNGYSDDNDSFCEDCSDLDCSNCCNISPTTGNHNLLSSSSDSEYSISGSCDNLSLCATPEKSTRRRNSGSPRSSPSKTDCRVTDESSPYSVSFREIDFENGDVMYIENSFNGAIDNWFNDSNAKLSSVCATPASSPKVNGAISLDNSPYPMNTDISLQCNSYQRNADITLESSALNHSMNKLSQSSHNNYHSALRPTGRIHERGALSLPAWSTSPGGSPQSSVHSNTSTPLSPSLSTCNSPTPLNLSQDSTFTNVSFEGSFAETTFSVRGESTVQRNESLCENSFVDQECSFSGRQLPPYGRHSVNMDTIVNNSMRYNQNDDSSILKDSVLIAKPGRTNQNQSLQTLNDSNLLQNTLRRNHNQSVGEINDYGTLNTSIRRMSKNNSFTSLNSSSNSCGNEAHFQRQRSSLSMNRIDQSFDRFDKRYASFHETSPASSPLDLSINKRKSENNKRTVTNKSDRSWVDRHVGQVYSPAKRVLHKNKGLSESDLCKQILDLYVSDADESGFGNTNADINSECNSSGVFHDTSMDSSNVSNNIDDFESTNLDDSGSEDERPGLHYGTYVAPRNVVKETNVDDFTTTTVWTCYTGEAKTRKLQGMFRYILSLAVR